jgi:hypothetical protein
MADEATLTIRFRDESSPGSGAGAVGPQGSGPQIQQDFVQATQDAITRAGGVGAYTTSQGSGVSSVAPVIILPAAGTAVPPTPTITTTTGDPQEQLLQAFLQKLSTREGGAEALLAMGVPPETVADTLQRTKLLNVPTEPLHDREYQEVVLKNQVEMRDRQSIAAVSADYEADRRRIEQQDRADRMAAAQRQQNELNRVLDDAKFNVPRPPPLTREQQLAESERIAPPPSGEEKEGKPERPDAYGLRSALDRIVGMAGYAGPEGQAIARIGQTVTPLAAEAGAAAGIGLGAARTAAMVAGVAAIPIVAAVAANAVASNLVAQIQTLSPEVALASAQAQVAEFYRTADIANKTGALAADYVQSVQNRKDATTGVWTDVREMFTHLGASINNAIGQLNDWQKGAEAQKKTDKDLDEYRAKRKQEYADWWQGKQSVFPSSYIPGSLLNIIPHLPAPFAKYDRNHQPGITPRPIMPGMPPDPHLPPPIEGRLPFPLG